MEPGPEKMSAASARVNEKGKLAVRKYHDTGKSEFSLEKIKQEEKKQTSGVTEERIINAYMKKGGVNPSLIDKLSDKISEIFEAASLKQQKESKSSPEIGEYIMKVLDKDIVFKPGLRIWENRTKQNKGAVHVINAIYRNPSGNLKVNFKNNTRQPMQMGDLKRSLEKNDLGIISENMPAEMPEKIQKAPETVKKYHPKPRQIPQEVKKEEEAVEK